MSQLSNKTVASSITINVTTSISKRPRSRPLLIKVYVTDSRYRRRIGDTVNNGVAWKTPSCICSCQWCIKSEVFCSNCWMLRQRLEAAKGCRRGPQYDGKCSFYLNYCILWQLTLLWPVYYDNWHYHLKNNKKWCIWSLHLHNFLGLPVFAFFLQKLLMLSYNSSNFIDTYLNLKLGTEKHIHLKWVLLPQWLVNIELAKFL